jgi:hypothetical protein
MSEWLAGLILGWIRLVGYRLMGRWRRRYGRKPRIGHAAWKHRPADRLAEEAAGHYRLIKGGL